VKLLIGSKMLAGFKDGTDLLCHHAKYGGDRGSHASCRPKSVMFLVCLFVALLEWQTRFWNDKVCDNGNAMQQCNFQNNYGAIA